MNQSQLAELFATSKQSISSTINNILKDNELNINSVVKDYLTTAADGKSYKVKFYSLEMIMALGFRVRSVRGVQFRQWANQHLRDFLQKGFIIDDERLKNPDGRPDYCDGYHLGNQAIINGRSEEELLNQVINAANNGKLKIIK